MEKKKTIIAIVLSAFLTLVISVTASFIVIRSEKVDNAAPYSYVDERDKEVKDHSDAQDNLIREDMKETNEEFNRKFNDMYDKIVDLWKARNN
jgi:uncharacterized protein YxeA